MTVQELEREQQNALPKEDLSTYAGQWVALRDGRVVASDLTGVALRDHPEVREDDILIPVPPARGAVFMLQPATADAAVPQVVYLPYRDPFNTGRARPYLLLHLVGLSGASGDVWGVVDSGADSTCLPLDFAPLMGYGPTGLRQEPFQQAGGTATCYIAKNPSVAWIPGFEELRFDVHPTFIDGASSVLWGRADLFRVFGVGFDEANQRFSLVIPN